MARRFFRAPPGSGTSSVGGGDAFVADFAIEIFEGAGQYVALASASLLGVGHIASGRFFAGICLPAPFVAGFPRGRVPSVRDGAARLVVIGALLVALLATSPPVGGQIAEHVRQLRARFPAVVATAALLSACLSGVAARRIRDGSAVLLFRPRLAFLTCLTFLACLPFLICLPLLALPGRPGARPLGSVAIVALLP